MLVIAIVYSWVELSTTVFLNSPWSTFRYYELPPRFLHVRLPKCVVVSAIVLLKLSPGGPPKPAAIDCTGGFLRTPSQNQRDCIPHWHWAFCRLLGKKHYPLCRVTPVKDFLWMNWICVFHPYETSPSFSNIPSAVIPYCFLHSTLTSLTVVNSLMTTVSFPVVFLVLYYPAFLNIFLLLPTIVLFHFSPLILQVFQVKDANLKIWL